MAKDFDGYSESIVLAKNRDLANAFWHGGDIYPHHVDEFGSSCLENHPTGVIPLLKTSRKKLHRFGEDGHEYICVEKR